MTLHRKNPRLSAKNYFGRQSYFITICCDRRTQYLAAAPFALHVVQIFLECAAKHSFLAHAYCVMPDHIHFLAEGTCADSDLREFVRLFKQRTAFAFRKRRGLPLWEMSYYEHILRPADAVEEVATYIWWNPVRKNLCPTPQEFPFSGSQTIDWMNRALLGTRWSAPWKAKKRPL
ncbi:MAG TPA: transposase [Candidatus Acidoferrum sp.]|nr:transposase [Candidatus Acidoferrum sp.]